jgi:hypothetical protein
MIRTAVGLVIGLLLIFPGLELLKWLATTVTGLYPDMTLTEACLGMIIILQSVSIVRTMRVSRLQALDQPRVQQAPRPQPRPQYQQPQPALTGAPVELHPQRAVMDGSVPPIRMRRLSAQPRPSRWRNIDLDDTPPRPSRPAPRPDQQRPPRGY